MLRNQLYPELETGTHFTTTKHRFVPVMDTTPDHIRQAIHEEQHGKDYHGKLVVAAHHILTDFYGLYDSVSECFERANVEAIGTGLNCDLYDKRNKMLIECGYINRFDETWPAFLEKAVSYAMPPGEIAENAAGYTFIHVPKSFFRDRSEFSNPRNVYDFSDHTFLELTFTEAFLKKADQHQQKRMSDVQEAVDNVSLG